MQLYEKYFWINCELKFGHLNFSCVQLRDLCFSKYPNPISVTWPWRSFPTDYLSLSVIYFTWPQERRVLGEDMGGGPLKATSQHAKVAEREKNQTLLQGKQKLHVPTCQRRRGCSFQLSWYLMWEALPPKFEQSLRTVCARLFRQLWTTSGYRNWPVQGTTTETPDTVPCPFFFCCLLKKWKRKKSGNWQPVFLCLRALE